MKTVWIYVNSNHDVGHPDHLKVFVSPEAAERWITENDLEGVAFEYQMDRSSEQDDEDATHRAIGRFLEGFSGIEQSLRYYLAIEVKIDMNYSRATITHDFALLCTAVHEVFNQTLKTDKKKKQLKKLMSRARELNDLRVKLAHGKWWADFEGGTLLHVSRRNLKESQFSNMAAHLEKQVDLTRDLFWDLTILLSHVEGQREDGSGIALAMARTARKLRAALAHSGPIDEELNRILEVYEGMGAAE